METLNVTKASGEQKPFSEEKIIHSLRRAGADEAQINDILEEVKGRLYEGITTKKIYRIAFSLLKAGSRHIAARYHLKQAIMELGPSGFPFERYIAEILRSENYSVQVGTIVQGICVKHEIDVIAEKDNEHLIMECKYHNFAGVNCDVKVPLYIHSRYLDVIRNHQKRPEPNKQYQGWVVTNTRFTEDALKYAQCSGLFALGWDYPRNRGLKDRIDRSGLYPVTCITSLTLGEKRQLLERGIVLCRDLLGREKLLRTIGLKTTRIAVILHETRRLCEAIGDTSPAPTNQLTKKS